MTSSSAAMSDSPMAAPLRESALCSLSGSGVASSAPMLNRSRWMVWRSPSENSGGSRARASPSAAFNSSTSPYAATRGLSLGVRPPPNRPVSPASPVRSEEHTSELQSQFHLVCRLLLEKKKTHLQHDYRRKPLPGHQHPHPRRKGR